MIRLLNDSDLPELVALHEKFYKNEFTLEDFLSNSINAFTIKDESDKIVSVLCLRTLLELNAITNKDQSVRKRRFALLQVLEYAKYFSNQIGFQQIHVSI